MLKSSPFYGLFSVQAGCSVWSRCLFCLYFVYLVTSLTVPVMGKAAAGALLLMGLFGVYRLRQFFYPLVQAEKWLLASFALFSVVSIVSFFYWPRNRLAQMHLEDYGTFLMLVPLYLLLRQFKFNFILLFVLLTLAPILLGVVSISQYVAMKYFHTQIFISENTFSQIWLRPSGGVNPMRYGAISVILAAISFNGILLLRHEAIWLKVVSALAVTLGLVACFLTQSRGGMVAVLVLSFVYGVYLYRTGYPKFLMLLIACSIVLVGVISQNYRVQKTMVNIVQYQNGDSNSSMGARLDMFKVALILIKEKPIWGYGLNSYSPNATLIRENSKGMSREVGLWANPHNEILQVMVEKGVIGLITLLFVFVAPGFLFWRAFRRSDGSVSGRRVKYYSMSGLSLLIVYAVSGQSNALFEHDIFNHFFTLMILLLASQIRVIDYEEWEMSNKGCVRTV